MGINTNKLIISSGSSETTPYISGITINSPLVGDYYKLASDGAIKDYIENFTYSGANLHLTGTTFDSGSYELTNTLNDGTTITANLSGLSDATYWTSGSSGTNSIKTISGGNTSTGNYSLAEGNHTTASGSYSHAEGYQTTASGVSSHSEGKGTIAIGVSSHSEGDHTIASGDNSHAEGSHTEASGNNSHSEGYNTIASGKGSHVEGYYTIASGLDSHTGGKGYSSTYTLIASGESSFNHSRTENGYTSNASGDYSAILGGKNNNATGEGTVVLGGNAITGTENYTTYVEKLNINELNTGTSVNTLGIDNNGNVVNGESINIHLTGTTFNSGSYELTNTLSNGTTITANLSGLSDATYWTSGSSGTNSIKTVGGYNTSTGNFSHAEGNGTEASGHYSHAEGQNTIASNDDSHAEGSITTASGNYSHSEGYYTIASGSSSHAEGRYTKSEGIGAHAGGTGGLDDFYNIQFVKATGNGSFNHSFVDESNIGASGDYSAILGGKNNNVTTIGSSIISSNQSSVYGAYSTILNSDNCNINHNYSAIIGCANVNSVYDNTLQITNLQFTDGYQISGVTNLNNASNENNIGEIPTVGLMNKATGGYTTKEIEISDWDMTNNIGLYHSIYFHYISDITKVREIAMVVRNDAGTIYRDLNVDGDCYIDDSKIYYKANAGGIFDSINYSSTGNVRGWLTIRLKY